MFYLFTSFSFFTFPLIPCATDFLHFSRAINIAIISFKRSAKSLEINKKKQAERKTSQVEMESVIRHRKSRSLENKSVIFDAGFAGNIKGERLAYFCLRVMTVELVESKAKSSVLWSSCSVRMVFLWLSVRLPGGGKIYGTILLFWQTFSQKTFLDYFKRMCFCNLSFLVFNTIFRHSVQCKDSQSIVYGRNLITWDIYWFHWLILPQE